MNKWIHCQDVHYCSSSRTGVLSCTLASSSFRVTPDNQQPFWSSFNVSVCRAEVAHLDAQGLRKFKHKMCDLVSDGSEIHSLESKPCDPWKFYHCCLIKPPESVALCLFTSNLNLHGSLTPTFPYVSGRKTRGHNTTSTVLRANYNYLEYTPPASLP